MATCTGSLYTCCCTRYSSRNVDNSLFPKYRRRSSQFPLSISFSSLTYSPSRTILAKALSSGDKSSSISGKKEQKVEEEEEEEVEEELPWIQEKALDLVEFTGSVTQAIPGPRVGQSSLPWVLAVPLAYLGITFVMAFVKTVRKFSSPREQRRKLVNKNAMLCKSIDELFEKGANEVDQSALKGLEQKTGFGMEEIFRKYIRYVLNEKPFNPELVSNLIQLRKSSMLDDSQVAGILNEISRRIVKEKGPVWSWICQDILKRVSKENLRCKLFSERCIISLSEDAEKLRLHTVSEAGDLDSLEKMVDGSDATDSSDEPSDAS
ncbi:UNVERIFIED_CONTAM: hypothetical protein Scaly_0963500 [Sesamum calycinum]|uniref:Armadillo-like repeats domain-containing protein n=1 Tax=Sesamum calycinum TaxID=2727403 RepID=A0AAW2QYJ5_9LAMI